MPKRSAFLKSATKVSCPCVSGCWGMYATVSQTVIVRNAGTQTPKETERFKQEAVWGKGMCNKTKIILRTNLDFICMQIILLLYYTFQSFM